MQQPEPNHKISGRVALVALLVAFGIAGLMVWIA